MANHSGMIQHVIYAEGRTPSSWNAQPTKATYTSMINIVPHLTYILKVEVLRNDLASSNEKVSNITLNGVAIGDCNPDGEDYDCTFFDCSGSLTKTSISSGNSSILAAFTYEGHSWDCDCDKETWKCSKENTTINYTPMTAVAKVTLTPLIGDF